MMGMAANKRGMLAGRRRSMAMAGASTGEGRPASG